jgi:hypothetical protein
VTFMPILPTQFADLEQFAPHWCLSTETERWNKRMASSMADIQAFYDAVTPRAEEAIACCDAYELDSMPEEVVNLMHLLYSWITVSFAVECWRQPQIPDAGATYLELLVAPGP